MSKTINCPYCNNDITLKVVYSYRGYKKEETNKNINNLLKEGTIYRNEKPKFEKYDFDGEKITARQYNKYCPNCKKYFHSISKMAVIDIKKIEFIYVVKNNRHRFDFNLSNDNYYSYKNNYVLINKSNLTNQEKYNILYSIKKSKINFWKKEYRNHNNQKYNWIIKIVYYNDLSDCFFGYNKVPDNWNIFIKGFIKIINKHEKNDIALLC